MNTAYLLLGTNMGDRQNNLEKARQLIGEQAGRVTRSSGIYETAAWGKTDQPSFLNQAIAIETSLNAKQLIRKILKLEKLLGRVRKEKYGPRIIDMDILLFNEETHQYPFLTIPHPEMQNRRFALGPLAEIAPGLKHPVFQKTISQLLEDCTDPLDVKRL
jgi:2-amino-4-hydroxy-6-hydroxymethyldihydropteridine diphosphokinase